MAAMGRLGDDRLAVLSPEQQAFLRRLGGTGAINPRTGLREFNFGQSIGQPVGPRSQEDYMAERLKRLNGSNSTGASTGNLYDPGNVSGGEGLGFTSPPGNMTDDGSYDQAAPGLDPIVGPFGTQMLPGIPSLAYGLATGQINDVGRLGVETLGALASTFSGPAGAALGLAAMLGNLLGIQSDPEKAHNPNPGLLSHVNVSTTDEPSEEDSDIGDPSGYGGGPGGEYGGDGEDGSGSSSDSPGGDNSGMGGADSAGGAQLARGGVVEKPDDAQKKLLRAGQQLKGLVKRASGGIADKEIGKVKSGSYVVPADAVAAAGQGNTLAGAKKLESIPGKDQKKGDSEEAEGEGVDVGLSGGEFVVTPEQLKAIGGGDIEKGRLAMNIFVHLMRAQMMKQMESMPAPAAPGEGMQNV
jgi:hypothetical protein